MSTPQDPKGWVLGWGKASLESPPGNLGGGAGVIPVIDPVILASELTLSLRSHVVEGGYLSCLYVHPGGIKKPSVFY